MDRLAAFLGTKAMKLVSPNARGPVGSQQVPAKALFRPEKVESENQRLVYEAALATARWKLKRLTAM